MQHKKEQEIIRRKIEGRLFELMNEQGFESNILFDCGANGIARVYWTSMWNVEWLDRPFNFISWSEK